MELPAELKTLYRHWEYHTGKSGTHNPLSKEIWAFTLERLRIWKEKVSGKAPPYTSDPILAKYRFCNVFREFDRQTIEIHRLLNPLRADFPLWLLNMFYARMVARPQTLREVGLLSFDPKENGRLYERLLALPRPRYGTPYVFPVSVIQKSATPTREKFIAEYLPRAIPRVAQEIETWCKESVYDGVQKILPVFGFNLSFLWTEVLIDVAYQFPERIDLFKRFPIGPGSRPTFLALTSDDPSHFAAELAAREIATDITYRGAPLLLSAENIEGIGCEYRKYTNLKAGRGRRRFYSP